MSVRSRLEMLGAGIALAACAAFIASFAFGLGSGGRSSAPQDPDTPVADPAPRTGRVEVLNASGRGGVARSVTHRLRTAGFDVVFFGNAPAVHGDTTVVLVRSAADDVARSVARELRIARVVSRPDSALFLDATVVIGRDWVEDFEPEQRTNGRLRRLGRWLTPGR